MIRTYATLRRRVLELPWQKAQSSQKHANSAKQNSIGITRISRKRICPQSVDSRLDFLVAHLDAITFAPLGKNQAQERTHDKNENGG